MKGPVNQGLGTEMPKATGVVPDSQIALTREPGMAALSLKANPFLTLMQSV
jgi:hypothetical protein